MSLIRAITPVARRSITHFSRPLSTTVRRFAVDPFPLPLSDPSLAASASKSPQTDGPKDGEEWPLPEPLDRSHEDEKALRARLVYQTRKRGTLETDLLLSTFARDQLDSMSVEELKQFDKVRAAFTSYAYSCADDSCSMSQTGTFSIGQ